jgi:hypothetical protein
MNEENRWVINMEKFDFSVKNRTDLLIKAMLWNNYGPNWFTRQVLNRSSSIKISPEAFIEVSIYNKHEI